MSKKPNHQRCAEIRIAGMTCTSCEILLERKLKSVSGVSDVTIDHRTGIATITADADELPSSTEIEHVVKKAGYSLAKGRGQKQSFNKRKWLEIGAALLIVFALYKLFSVFDLVSLAPSTSGALTFGGIFFIGIIAGTTSCLAVTGGLLLSMAAKYHELHPAQNVWEKFKPLLWFNGGRLISYFVLGGVIGVIGQSISLSVKTTGYMNIVIALVMLYLALTILQIVPKGAFPIRPPKKLSHWIADLSDSNHPAAPFALGAMTFFLPCGFTQSLQLVALASGGFLAGAMTMFVFALGTLPSLIGISAISSAAKGAFSHWFLRISGAVVLVLSVFNLNSGFLLTGVDVPRTIAAMFGAGSSNLQYIGLLQNGVQELSMRVTAAGYEPSELTVKAGIPVRWTIDGDGARGCTSVLVVPELNITKPLASGMNEIDFTPPSTAQDIAFSCSMGMVRGTIHVL